MPDRSPAPDDDQPGDELPNDADDRALSRAKTVLRRAVRLRREARPDAVRARDDLARFAILRDHLGTAGPPSCVACYLSSPPEPDTRRLLGWLAAAGVEVLLPKLTATGDGRPSSPDWANYAGPDRLQDGPFGLLQPTTPGLGPEALGLAELIIVPGLAANSAGDRLGRGGGWYDRALGLAAASATSVVLLNEDELLPVIPCQSWDRRVGAVLTPAAWVACAVLGGTSASS